MKGCLQIENIQAGDLVRSHIASLPSHALVSATAKGQISLTCTPIKPE